MNEAAEVRAYLEEQEPLPPTPECVHVTIIQCQCLRCFNSWTNSHTTLVALDGSHLGTANPHTHRLLPLRSYNQIVRTTCACHKCVLAECETDLSFTPKADVVNPKISAKQAKAEAFRKTLLE